MRALTPEQRRLAELLLRQRGMTVDDLPIPRRGDSAVAPLSSTQQRLWNSGRLAQGTPYGNVPMAFRVSGPLDLAVLGRSLSGIVERHEVLRTTFPLENERPVQRIHGAAAIDIPVQDLRSLRGREQTERLYARLEEESRRPFDPATETLLRAFVFRLDADEWVLLLVSHHLALDGWGARLLLDELRVHYDAFLGAREPALTDLHVQYGDYAAWELRRVGSEAYETDRQYWQDWLAGATRQIRLPYLPAQAWSVDSALMRFAVPPEMAERLAEFSRSRGVTLYATVLAAFATLLQRYAGQSEMVLGTIASQRTRSETECLIGNFGNNLLLRVDFGGGPDLGTVVERVSRVVGDALAHATVPLERVAETSAIPAFQVMFVMRDSGLSERLTLRGIRTSDIAVSARASALDLILDVTDGATGLECILEYRRDRFAEETIQVLGQRLIDVLERLTAQPETLIDALPSFAHETVHVTRHETGSRDEPETATEAMLARAWCEVLNVERVSRDDVFFDLGGDSLRAMTVIAQVERETGHRLQPLDLATQTLRQLAAVCAEAANADDRTPPPLSLLRRLVRTVTRANGSS